MPDLHWEDGWSNYTPSQSMTISQSVSESTRLVDSLSNTATVKKVITSTGSLRARLSRTQDPGEHFTHSELPRFGDPEPQSPVLG